MSTLLVALELSSPSVTISLFLGDVNMMKYDWILFDLDETLIRFNSYDALQYLFKKYKTPFRDTDFIEYESKNKALWHQYQNEKINITQLQKDRFAALGKRFHQDPLTLNNEFLHAISEVSTPIDGAITLLDQLKGKAKLGIITNGFTDMQKMRLIKNGMQNHFDFVVTSEEVGSPKPQSPIFDHTFKLMNHPSREKILIVGDTLESDILGGINAGIHTCWLNHHGKTAPKEIKPHFEIATLDEFDFKR